MWGITRIRSVKVLNLPDSILPQKTMMCCIYFCGPMPGSNLQLNPYIFSRHADGCERGDRSAGRSTASGLMYPGLLTTGTNPQKIRS